MKSIFTTHIVYKLVLIAIGVIVGVVIISPIFRSEADEAARKNAEDAKFIKETVEDLSKLMLVPKDENPVLATIVDAEKLAKEQLFYADAINGDVLLVFQKSFKAVIYSPSRNIIVNVGFISSDTNTSAEQPKTI